MNVTSPLLRTKYLLPLRSTAYFAFFILSSITGSVLQAATSISQYGITWTFDGDYTVGQFVTGDYWVVGPVTITSVSPSPTGNRNGSAVNPIARRQGYDSRGGGFNTADNVSFPYTLQPGQSMVSSDSKPESSESFTNVGPIQSQAVLTAVSAAQSSGAFRPGFCGTYKQYFSTSQVNYGLLPNESPLSTTPSGSSLLSWTDMPKVDHIGNWSFQHSCAQDNFTNGHGHPCYGRDYAEMLSEAMLYTMLDTSNKTALANNIIQIGIDNYAILKAGGGWGSDGGHNSGRKAPIVYAAILLNDPDMLAVGTDYGGSYPKGQNGNFQENDSCYYGVSKALFGLESFGNFCPGSSGGSKDQRDPNKLLDACQYVVHNGQPWSGTALAMRMINAISVWNYNAFFEFTDRWMDGDVNGGGSSGFAFVDDMWLIYRDNLPPPGGGNQVLAPQFSPVAGSYGSAQSVAITTGTGGASIRYTTNGSNPTSTSGTVYSSPVSVSSDTTLKAIAYKSGLDDSSVTSGAYVIDTQAPGVPSSLSSSNITATTVDLDWNASSDTGTGVAGYKVYTGGSNPVDVGDVTSVTMSGLTPDTSYSFTVSAYDAVGNESNPSSSANITTEDGPADPLAPNIVAYWGFNSLASGSTPDDSGNGHGGTVTGGVSLGSGQIDNALDFNGSNGEVDAGNFDVTPDSGNDGITLAAWISPDNWVGSSHDDRIISKSTGTGEQDHYWMLSPILDSSNNRLRMRLKTGGTTSTLISSSGNIQLDTWTHVAGTYDGSTMRVYINGTQVGSTSKSGTVSTSGSVGVSIGVNPDGSRPFDGLIDEVYVLDRALDASEIAALMARDPSSSGDTEAPSVPTGLAASNVTDTTVDLDWNASTDDVGVAGYNIYINGTNPMDAGNVTSATVADLTSSTTYTFSVSAYDAASNESNQSSGIQVTTDPTPDTTPPSVPQNLASSNITQTTVALSWDTSTDTGGSGVDGYFVYIDGSNPVDVGNVTDYTMTSLTPSTSYAFTVSAYDLEDNESNQSSAVNVTTATPADTTPPSVPTGLAASNETTTTVDLSWNAATDTGGSGLAGYKVYIGGANPINVGNVTSYTVTGLTASSSYTFTVSVYDGASNESAQSSGVNATTASGSGSLIDEDFSSGAGNFTVISGGTWSVSSGRYVLSSPSNASAGLLGNISVHNTTIGNGYVLTTVLNITGNTEVWNDAAVVFGYQDSSNYYYVSLNESNDTNTRGIFKVASGTPTELADISSSITSDTDYEIEITHDGTSIIVKLDGNQVASTTDSTFSGGKVGYGSKNDGAQFDDLLVVGIGGSDTTAPSVPTGLAASNETTTTVDLSWNAATDTGGSGLAGYKVYIGGANPIDVGNVTSYTVTGLTASSSYTFTVSAYDGASNESAQSSGVGATTSAGTLIDEDFGSGAGNFSVVSGGTWSVSGGRYVLSSPASSSTAGVLGNISVHDTSVNGDFTLSVLMRITGTSSDWNDAAIVFGYQDANNYYYVSLNESNDGNTKGILKVVNGTPTELANITISVSSDTDYTVEIERSGSSIVAKVNGNQVASATDSTFTSGQVGLGTYNDGAEFDDLIVE